MYLFIYTLYVSYLSINYYLVNFVYLSQLFSSMPLLSRRSWSWGFWWTNSNFSSFQSRIFYSSSRITSIVGNSRPLSRLFLRRNNNSFVVERRFAPLNYSMLLSAYSSLANNLFFFNSKFTLLQRTYHSVRLSQAFLRRMYFNSYFSRVFNKFSKNSKTFLPDSVSVLSALFYNIYSIRRISSSFSSSYYFFNADNSPLLAMNNARSVYSAFLFNNTLRNTQYNIWLQNDINSCSNLSIYNCTISLILKAYKFTLGWYQTHLLISAGFVLYNASHIVYNDLYLQPFDVVSFVNIKGISFFLSNHSNNAFNNNNNLNNQGYLWSRVNNVSWMSSRRNSIRLTRWARTYHDTLNSCFMFDFFTYTGILLSSLLNVNSKRNPKSESYTSILKLYRFRFSAS